jgi:hypothetical protein
MRQRSKEGCFECLKIFGGDGWHRHLYITFSACEPQV